MSLLNGFGAVGGASAAGAIGGGLDFNQLLRESRHLETAMEGVSSSVAARPGLLGAAGLGASPALRVPTLQRNLAQLGAASRRLARTQAPSDASSDSQAQLLLSAKGIDLRKQQRALKDMELSLPAQHAAQPAQGIDSFHPLDIERFLQHQQQLLCLQAMEEAAKVTSDTYRLHDLSSLSDDWEVSKREILDSLGFRGGKSALGSEPQEVKRKAPTQHAALHAGPTGPVLAMEQAIYARTVQELNHARVRRAPTDLLANLKLASAQVDEFFDRAGSGAAQGLAPGDVADCWDVLRCMLQGGGDEFKDSPSLLEKVYSSAWCAASGTAEHARLQSQLVAGARVYSEQLFEAYVRQVVAKYPEARKLQHGKPAFVQQVTAYVSILTPQLPACTREAQLDGVAFWPQVYFAFRCGHVEAALELMHRHLGRAAPTNFARPGASMGLGLGGGSSSSHEQNRVLVEAMEKRAQKDQQGTLHAHLWTALHEEFQRELSSAVNSARAHGSSSSQAGNYADPFKLALYHLLGRFKLPAAFDISRHVAPTTEDYLWLKLSVLADGGASGGAAQACDGLGVPEALRDSIDAQALRLEHLQADLLARGEHAFNPDGRHPLSYFKVLLLSQQFEQAVYFLIKTPFFTVGVHFAIALDYLGVLHSHANAQQELLVAQSADVHGDHRFALNYSRVLRKYVEAFVRTHPFEAFHYLYLLHVNSASGGAGGSSRRARGVGIGNSSFGLLAGGSTNDDMDEDSSYLQDRDGAVNTADPSFSAMRDLLLETKEYELLVGTIVSSGGHSSVAQAAAPDSIQTQRGLITNYYSRAESAYLLVHTASTMEAHGLTLDAIQLYLLSYRFDLAVELLLKALSPLVAQSVQTTERQALVELAQKVQRVVRNQQAGGHMDSRVRSASSTHGAESGEATALSLHALHQLLLLVNYFDLYHLGPGQYESALIVLGSPDLGGLVPFHSDDCGDSANAFGNPSVTHRAVQRCMSEIALSTMDIYYVHAQMVKREMNQKQQGGFGLTAGNQRDQAKQQRLVSLRSQARALLTFLGLIQSSMQVDPDVFGKLVQVEALMAA